ncbi:MAG: hypothetical protein AAGJ81_15100 [Verrucomicrobiota bacterium]
MMKAGIKILAVIVSGVLLVWVCVEIWVVRPSWPELTEGQKSELLRIVEMNRYSEDRELREDEISEELRDIAPYGIWIENGSVVVLVSGGGIGPGWGYLISTDGRAHTGDQYLYSPDPRFQRFLQDR